MTAHEKRATDRRVQRTRRLLQDALISMIIEKGFEATTVQDIIDRADVGRATFYAHFADKETLLGSGLEDLRRSLSEQQRHKPGSLAFGLAMLQHAHGHLPVWTAIAGRKSGTLVLQRVQAMITDLVAADIKALVLKRTPAERQLAVQYIAGAFMAVLTWWLDQGATVPPDEVDHIFRRLVMQGLEGELGLRSSAIANTHPMQSL